MKRQLLMLTLSGLLSLPALAQMSPAQTNLDPAAARKETRNARGAQLTPVTQDQGMANELRRCANLPAFYKTDCESRVRGQGATSGSVIGGGLVKESVTTMPQAELDEQLKGMQPMTMPAPTK